MHNRFIWEMTSLHLITYTQESRIVKTYTFTSCQSGRATIRMICNSRNSDTCIFSFASLINWSPIALLSRWETNSNLINYRCQIRESSPLTWNRYLVATSRGFVMNYSMFKPPCAMVLCVWWAIASSSACPTATLICATSWYFIFSSFGKIGGRVGVDMVSFQICATIHICAIVPYGGVLQSTISPSTKVYPP